MNTTMRVSITDGDGVVLSIQEFDMAQIVNALEMEIGKGMSQAMIAASLLDLSGEIASHTEGEARAFIHRIMKDRAAIAKAEGRKK